MITVVREPEEFGRPTERCAFCWRRTAYWFEPKDVAVCPICARTVKAKDVPSKAEWWFQETGLHTKKNGNG